MPPASPSPLPQSLALVMGGGGARSAYQVGVLRGIAKDFPELGIDYLNGVSAGAINTAFLANSELPFHETVDGLAALWSRLECADVFEVSGPALLGRALRVVARFVIGARQTSTPVQGLVDTEPLRQLLTDVLAVPAGAPNGALVGVRRNLAKARLRAVALTATRYNTGQTVTFFDGAHIDRWERPQRRSEQTALGVEHIMASAALPLFFPAVEIDGNWYGDGGVRQIAPLAPALHLGADRMLAISTRHGRSGAEANVPTFDGPPSPAQVLGSLYSAIFLDMLDSDAHALERVNELLRMLPPDASTDLRPVELLVLRPSQDLGKLADEFEAQLPSAFRFLTRRLGTKQARSQDLISTVMFQADYITRLIELGEADARDQREAISAFLAPCAGARPPA